MKCFRYVGVFGLLLLNWYSVYSQDKIFMPFFEIINIHQDYQYSTAKLLKVYIENSNKFELILPEKPDSAPVKLTFDESRLKAEMLHTKYFLLGEMNRVGDIVIINVNMYTTVDGKKYWHGIFKAANPSDIDPVLSRIAASLGDHSSSTNEDIYNVTQYEANELHKIGSNRYWGVFIGGGTTFAKNIQKNFPAGFGVLYAYDNRNVIFDLRGQLFWSDVDIYSVNFNILIPASKKANSLFVSGGMGYGGITITNKTDTYNNSQYQYYNNNHSSGGLFLTGGLGYLMNRNSDVSIRIGGELQVPVFSVSNNDLPVAVLFTTTLSFGR